MKDKRDTNLLIIGLCVAVSLFFIGLFIYKGLNSISNKDRYVSVRGLSEKEVSADYATLTISYSEGSNDMKQLLTKIEQNNKKVIAFIKSKGLTESEINVGVASIKDKWNSEYGDGGKKDPIRYYGSITVKVFSPKVKQVLTVEQNEFELYKQGVNISQQQNYDMASSGSSNYTFTKLNDIKPQMIKESTENARRAGQQFANDSHSKLGGIKEASQGQFEISPTNDPLKLKIRVVSSISFFLE
jgi:Uncharacterized protein conserved in bacteria